MAAPRRRRGDGTAGWSEEISEEQFTHAMQTYIDKRAPPMKAFMRVMAGPNISLDDLKAAMSYALILYALSLLQTELEGFKRMLQ